MPLARPHRAFLVIRVGEAAGNGVIVVSVTPAGAAAKADMRVGDIIVSVNAASTPTVGALSAVLAELKPGQNARVKIVAQSGNRATLRVTLGTYPGG